MNEEEEIRYRNAQLVLERTNARVRNWRHDEELKRHQLDPFDPYGGAHGSAPERVRESAMDFPIQSLARGRPDPDVAPRWEYFAADSLTMNPARQAWFQLLSQQQQSQPPTWYRSTGVAPETIGRASSLPGISRFLDRDDYFQPIGATPRIKGPMVTD